MGGCIVIIQKTLQPAFNERPSLWRSVWPSGKNATHPGSTYDARNMETVMEDADFLGAYASFLVSEGVWSQRSIADMKAAGRCVIFLLQTLPAADMKQYVGCNLFVSQFFIKL